ncbi:hypothetical protein ACQ4M3_27340 [Leptolyngbya sp. AN03gr2]|uniref:hypothetical protein n=1 Tax=unclassified Leptolyngbya TaxID=2650499 RepID=UPI003D317876
MRRSIRFFLHSTIALFVVLVNVFMIQLIFHAPMPVGGRVAGLQLGSLFIPGQAIACSQMQSHVQSRDFCQILLFDRPLELTMTSARSEVKQCELSYAGRTAKCEGNYHTLIIGGWMPVITTNSNLGLNANQIATLREQYPQRNFFLYEIGETRLLQSATGIAIAAGLLTFFFGWLHFSEIRLYAGFGLVVFIVTWIISNAMIWGLGYVD